MLTKTHPNSLYGILFSRMILDGIAGIQFILQEIFAFAFLKPYSFYTLFSSTYKKKFSDKIL
jgi:hypothetical protein